MPEPKSNAPKLEELLRGWREELQMADRIEPEMKHHQLIFYLTQEVIELRKQVNWMRMTGRTY